MEPQPGGLAQAEAALLITAEICVFAYTVWECELKICTQRDSLSIDYIRKSTAKCRYRMASTWLALPWAWGLRGALLWGGQQWEPVACLPPPLSSRILHRGRWVG